MAVVIVDKKRYNTLDIWSQGLSIYFRARVMGSVSERKERQRERERERTLLNYCTF